MRRIVSATVFCVALCAGSIAGAKGDSSGVSDAGQSREQAARSRDYLDDYPNVLADFAPDQHARLTGALEFGPHSMVSLNFNFNYLLPKILNVNADAGLGFGTGRANAPDDSGLSWLPNPWGAVSVGYPLVGRTRHGGGRWVISRSTTRSGNYEITHERYFNIELPVQRRFVVEATMRHGTPNYDFDNRSTAFGAGFRYMPTWSSLMRINTEGGTYYQKVIEHTWSLSGHVLFAEIGPRPAETTIDWPVGFDIDLAMPYYNDRDQNMNLVLGFAVLPNGGAAARLGFQGAWVFPRGRE